MWAALYVTTLILAFGLVQHLRHELRRERGRIHYVRLIRRSGEDTYFLARLGHGSSPDDFTIIIESDVPLKARTEPKGQ